MCITFFVSDSFSQNVKAHIQSAEFSKGQNLTQP